MGYAVSETNMLIKNYWNDNFNTNSTLQITITIFFLFAFGLFILFISRAVLYRIYIENDNIVKMLFFFPFEIIEKNKIIMSFLHSYIKIQ